MTKSWRRFGGRLAKPRRLTCVVRPLVARNRADHVREIDRAGEWTWTIFFFLGRSHNNVVGTSEPTCRFSTLLRQHCPTTTVPRPQRIFVFACAPPTRDVAIRSKRWWRYCIRRMFAKNVVLEKGFLVGGGFF